MKSSNNQLQLLPQEAPYNDFLAASQKSRKILEVNKTIRAVLLKNVGYDRCSTELQKMESIGEIFPRPMWTFLEGFQRTISINGEHFESQNRKTCHFSLKVCRKPKSFLQPHVSHPKSKILMSKQVS